MELRAANIIDPAIEGHYAFYPFVEGISTREHQHDFYEIFLIMAGSIEHHVNGDIQLLEHGTLVFIRPDDAHFFKKYGGENCKLINVAFLTQTFDAIVTFLTIQTDDLLITQHPPTIVLSNNDRVHLQMRLQNWGRMLYGDKIQSKQTLRTLLAHIISQHFISQKELVIEQAPLWLIDLTRMMQKQEHFIAGREELFKLSNRTPEYVSRSFKTYLGITPSQFINDLRLTYASDLLLNTDYSPTEIAYEVGFGNLSYFYHLFKLRWHCSPNQYRRQYQQTLRTGIVKL